MINMKCFDEEEIKVIKAALKCELRKNKKSTILEDAILEKVEHFKCPDKEFTVNQMKNLPLSERCKLARMIR